VRQSAEENEKAARRGLLPPRGFFRCARLWEMDKRKDRETPIFGRMRLTSRAAHGKINRLCFQADSLPFSFS
jgi:hypothetical protein